MCIQVQIQAGIDDKHVVKIYDTINVPGTKKLFIVMEFCEGGNLLQWIKRNRKHKMLNQKIILQMLQELCEAVHSCHQKRIIHRDLKPENVLLDGKRRIKLGGWVVCLLAHGVFAETCTLGIVNAGWFCEFVLSLCV